MQFDKEFDASGLSCPMPIVKTKKALSSMASGQVLRVVATDPGSVKDFAAWSKSTGNEIVEQTVDGSVFRFVLRRK